jgi:hypothetical protein
MTQSSESPHAYIMAVSFSSLLLLHLSLVLTIAACRDAITIVADAKHILVSGVVMLDVLEAQVN